MRNRGMAIKPEPSCVRPKPCGSMSCEAQSCEAQSCEAQSCEARNWAHSMGG